MNWLLGKFLQITVFDDVKLRLINPLEYQQRTLLLGKEVLELEVAQALSSVLRAGMTFFDIGANLGYYTLLASKMVGATGRVHAFEPAPTQFRHLVLNVKINKATNIRLNELALADSNGNRELFLSDGWNQGIHSFSKATDRTRSCVVSCTSLDEYVSRVAVGQIHVMKVDAEGAELLIFGGAQKTLADLPPRVIIFEACEEHAQAQGYTTSEVKRLLSKERYRILRLRASGPPIEASLSSPETYANLIAVHASADDRYYKALGADLAMHARQGISAT